MKRAVLALTSHWSSLVAASLNQLAAETRRRSRAHSRVFLKGGGEGGGLGPEPLLVRRGQGTPGISIMSSWSSVI